ncbi:MAG: hypothetical protein ACREWI_04275, partial [Telluria sp.]
SSAAFDDAGRYSLFDNVQDSYGEVLLATGHPAKAKAQFLKAIALARRFDARHLGMVMHQA